MPLDLAAVLGTDDANAQKVWGVMLLVYCLVAGVLPMWLLLQPRGHLGGYFLYIALIGGSLGLILSGQDIKYPAVTDWHAAAWTPAGWFTPAGWTYAGNTVVPFLFITIACGACSGFHSLIASGTTSKQLRSETDALPIGYGAMLLEAMVAVISLSCVMILATDAKVLQVANPKSNYIYASGVATYLQALHIPWRFAVTFGLLAFTTFVYDTLDVCTRLGRYILQELTGWKGRFGAIFGTALTAGVPLALLLPKTEKPIWLTFWNLFGASNQLLAALTLLGVTVWLWRTRGAWWVWLVTGLPTVWMYVMSSWALISMTWPEFFNENGEFTPPADPVPWAGALLVVLAALMLIEACIAIFGHRGPPVPKLERAGMPQAV
jgi:carbon starvation protein